MSQQIDDVLTQAVQNGAVPNVVAVVSDADGIRYTGSAGVLGPDTSETVDGDTVFRIMSMTKMIVTAAALQLLEEGRLDLDAPVATYCPEFGNRKVLTGFDGDTPLLREPTTQATVKHLITHTAGHGYMFFDADLHTWEEVTGYPGILAGVPEVLDSPLLFDPGERYEYGMNIDVLAEVVATIAGKRLDEHLAEAVLGPLGMSSTSYHKKDVDQSAITPVQVHGPDGSWVDSGVDYAQDPTLIPGGHGLYSTPNDYTKFTRALLRGGELDGVRILQPQTVDAAFTNQLGELEFPATMPSADAGLTADFAVGPGYTWGHGLLLNRADVPGARRAGSGGWAGLCNTHFWIDRTTGICGGIYSQTLPFVDPPAFQMYVDFEHAVYATLT